MLILTIKGKRVFNLIKSKNLQARRQKDLLVKFIKNHGDADNASGEEEAERRQEAVPALAPLAAPPKAKPTAGAVRLPSQEPKQQRNGRRHTQVEIIVPTDHDQTLKLSQ